MTARRGALSELRGLLASRVAPPRFVMFVVLMGLVALAWRALHAAPAGDALVMGFDVAAITFMASLVPLLRDRSAGVMRLHSAQNDANRGTILLITAATAIAILTAIAAELPDAKQGHVLAIAKLIITLTLSWFFSQVIFALHYAHMFYGRGKGAKDDAQGFDFPGTKEPDYWDFLYFSFTAGMSFAASDVNVTRGEVRKIVVLQSLLSFVFNIGVLAFSINVLAGAAG